MTALLGVVYDESMNNIVTDHKANLTEFLSQDHYAFDEFYEGPDVTFNGSTFRHVHDEVVRTTDWESVDEFIVRCLDNDTLYRFTVRKGLTELQESYGYTGDEVEVVKTVTETIVVTRYVAV